jgi:hypothetical protein
MSKASEKAKAGFGAALAGGMRSRAGGAQLPAQVAAAEADLAPQQRLEMLEGRIELSKERHDSTVRQAEIRHRYEVGQAFMEIRKDHLYELQGYNSFARYVEGRWGWKRQHAYRLIDLVPVRAALAPLADASAADLRPGPARVLAQLARARGDEAVRSVWRAVAEAGEAPTAVRLSAVSDRMFSDPVPPEASPIGDTNIVDAEIIEDEEEPYSPAELVNQELAAAADAAERAVARLAAALDRGVAADDASQASRDLSRIRSAAVRLGKRAEEPPAGV